MNHKLFTLLATAQLSAFLLVPNAANASPENYIVTPIVEEGEHEIDIKYGSTKTRTGEKVAAFSIGYGIAVNARWFTELYAKYASSNGERTFDAFAWENRYQLTEQGKYWLDAGLLLEIERPKDRSEGYEVTYGLLLQKEQDRLQYNLNLLLQRHYKSPEFQQTILMYQAQAKYRYNPAFEPGIQALGNMGKWNSWSGGNNANHAIGPAVFGKVSLGAKRKLAYNAAILRGTTLSTPKTTFRLQTEYEF